jgi:hypothetical protein
MIEQQPVSGTMRAGSKLAATGSSSSAARASINSDFAPLLMPNSANLLPSTTAGATKIAISIRFSFSAAWGTFVWIAADARRQLGE